MQQEMLETSNKGLHEVTNEGLSKWQPSYLFWKLL